jgi:hypothetical protein
MNQNLNFSRKRNNFISKFLKGLITGMSWLFLQYCSLMVFNELYSIYVILLIHRVFFRWSQYSDKFGIR